MTEELRKLVEKFFRFNPEITLEEVIQKLRTTDEKYGTFKKKFPAVMTIKKAYNAAKKVLETPTEKKVAPAKVVEVAAKQAPKPVRLNPGLIEKMKKGERLGFCPCEDCLGNRFKPEKPLVCGPCYNEVIDGVRIRVKAVRDALDINHKPEPVPVMTDSMKKAVKVASSPDAKFSPEEKRMYEEAWNTWEAWKNEHPMAFFMGKVVPLSEQIVSEAYPHTTAELIAKVIGNDRGKNWDSRCAEKRIQADLLAEDFWQTNPFDDRKLYEIVKILNGAMDDSEKIPEKILSTALYQGRKATRINRSGSGPQGNVRQTGKTARKKEKQAEAKKDLGSVGEAFNKAKAGGKSKPSKKNRRDMRRTG